MRTALLSWFLIIAALTVCPPLALAEKSAGPQRPATIRLAGNLQQGAPTRITVDDLEALPQSEFSVKDPY